MKKQSEISASPKILLKDQRLFIWPFDLQDYHNPKISPLGQLATAGRSKANIPRPWCSSRRTSHEKTPPPLTPPNPPQKQSVTLGNVELKILALIRHHLQTSPATLGVSRGAKLQRTNPITSDRKTCPGITLQHLGKQGAPWWPGATTHSSHVPSVWVFGGTSPTAAEL